MKIPVFAALLLMAALIPNTDAAESKQQAFVLTALSFRTGGMIPVQHTCSGKNESPALKWANPPKGTQSFTLIVEDKDAPGKIFTHWILINLPPTIDNLPGGIPAINSLANGEINGKNDFARIGYGGPCPPEGDKPHTYIFTLYALDTSLRLKAGSGRAEIDSAMEGHVLGKASVSGLFSRASFPKSRA